MSSEITYEELEYNGKHFKLPIFPKDRAYTLNPQRVAKHSSSPIIKRMNSLWDLKGFLEPAEPIQLTALSAHEQYCFSMSRDIPEVLDLPIKMLGTNYRVPSIYTAQLPFVDRVAQYEAQINPLVDEYYAYFTFRHSFVKKGTAQHAAPVHVDGFQGGRWHPRKRINHSYTIAISVPVDTTPAGAIIGVPTTYFVQPFWFGGMDETKHDFFWEMNYQVAQTNARHAWQGTAGVPELMDAYCAHYGSVADCDQYRFWARISFEERIFDRLGNAHNPAFDYDWNMVVRDIEQLNLVPFRPDCEASLRVFPWQALDGSRNPKGVKTLPNLRPFGCR